MAHCWQVTRALSMACPAEPLDARRGSRNRRRTWNPQPPSRAPPARRPPTSTSPTARRCITDDHSPYELSLALDGHAPEVRFLVEAQGEPTTLQSSWVDGLAMCERLQREFGVSLERLARVLELFEPRNPEARFSLWHAFGMRAGGTPDLKVYLNPMARGPGQASTLVEEALSRLGFTSSWRFISREVMHRGGPRGGAVAGARVRVGPAARVLSGAERGRGTLHRPAGADLLRLHFE
jgi:hypothetical protein